MICREHEGVLYGGLEFPLVVSRSILPARLVNSNLNKSIGPCYRFLIHLARIASEADAYIAFREYG